MKLWKLLGLAAAVGMQSSFGEVVLENPRLKLVLSDNGAAKSLVVKASGEEMLDTHEDLRAFTIVQDRPFNNEIKLLYPTKRTEFRARRVRREGDFLWVDFELIPYAAKLKIDERDDYIALEVVDFPMLVDDRIRLDMTYPPVAVFKFLELPVANRVNYGDWLNVMWDDRAALAVVGAEPFTWIDSEARHGFRIFSAEAHHDLKLVGARAAIVAGAGREDFLDAMDGFERKENLPRGVRSRRSKDINQSALWVQELDPELADDYIRRCREGGFKRLLVYEVGACDHCCGYWSSGSYRPHRAFTNGYETLRATLAKIKAAGISPGLHVLQTFIGFGSEYVSPVADPRLNLKRHFTLAKPLATDATEVFVQENPAGSPTNTLSSVLAFNGELMTYSGFTVERPYRFTGVHRGSACEKTVKPGAPERRVRTVVREHPRGEIGGLLDVCEFGGLSCYIDQRSDLQDEIAAKIAKIYDCGFEFMYCDGSEGVNAPQGIYVPLAQYRVWRALGRKPDYMEGAAKGHFGWHWQSGANAFDVFAPEEFKAMLVKWPLHEAPIMAQNMTRLNFGWWGYYLPKEKSIGVQPDLWEFGTSKAAAWDSPATIFYRKQSYLQHPRSKDLFATMRRWEEVRAKGLPDSWRRLLRDPKREFHLISDGHGFYELVEWRQLLVAGSLDSRVRAFLYEKGNRRVVVYWHTHGEGTLVLADGTRLPAAEMREFESDLASAEVERLFADATIKHTF